MLRRQRLTVELIDNPRLVAGDVIEWKVGRVAAVGEDRRELRGGIDAVHQLVDGDALPYGVELRPLGHAVDVLGHGLRRQRDELLPGPSLRLVDLALDGEGPLVEIHARRRPRR